MSKQPKVTRLIVCLTVVFILLQVLFLMIHGHASGMDKAVWTEIHSKLSMLGIFVYPSKWPLLYPLLQFVLSQCLLYILYGFLLWYVTTSMARLFSLGDTATRLLAYVLWVSSLVLVFFANAYYVPHSFFSTLVQHDLLNDALNYPQIYQVVWVLVTAWLAMLVLAIIRSLVNMSRRHARISDGIALALFVFSIAMISVPVTPPSEKLAATSAATVETPNIIIIGFDALRPDFLSYFNPHVKVTPQFDTFLNQSTVFTETYTPDARTFPSWVSILTAQYPLHHKAREDNVDLVSVQKSELLTTRLKEKGYELLYASDDNRFNNINNASFGFDRVIGPSGNAVDFVVNSLNDFPLSNMLVTTVAGKWLFPYTIANHASPHVYTPDNFLTMLDAGLQQRDKSKPLFLAAHIDVTAWPFYYFNDRKPYNASDITLYKNVVTAADKQLGGLMRVLERQGVLDHAIFVLMSDHGITLQFPGDRIVSEPLFQGSRHAVKLKQTKYGMIAVVAEGVKYDNANGEEKIIRVNEKGLSSNPAKLQALYRKIASPMNPGLYGIDTSWGYGNDVLSLKQNKPLLAFRLYGLTSAAPHRVSGRSMLMDITPTLLDFLALKPLRENEGLSLRPYIQQEKLAINTVRPVFLESSYSIPELERANVLAEAVLKKSLSLYQINPDNALISMIPEAQQASIEHKQRAIILGDWMMAFYPSSSRYRFDLKSRRLEEYTQPPYAVLVNVRTGQWTTDLTNDFAAHAPVRLLSQKITQFYGKEMAMYALAAQHSFQSVPGNYDPA